MSFTPWFFLGGIRERGGVCCRATQKNSIRFSLPSRAQNSVLFLRSVASEVCLLLGLSRFWSRLGFGVSLDLQYSPCNNDSGSDGVLMSSRIVYLFPDTNLFIQGKKLHLLDWSAWFTFDEVHLIVCAPVLREIDAQKKRGNDRVGRRAREASGLFRDVAMGGGVKVIRDSGPGVKLNSTPPASTTPSLRTV